MTGINVFDGKGIKAIDFSPWGGIDGFLEATSGAGYQNQAALRGLVPWLQKGVTMTGNAVAQLPYDIEDAAGNEVDKDAAWGGVLDPRKYIKLVADALCGGAAYLAVKTTNRAIVSMQYILPSTMTPNYDQEGKVISFTRDYNGKRIIMPLEEVIYFWLPDDTVETGPAQVHPLKNATLPAQLIAGMDGSLKQYSERGFIPPTILSVKGMPNQAEREKTEKWWNAFLRGWTKTAAKIVNSESMTPQVVGAGMDELRGTYTQITRQQIENIAASFDIPMSLFMSNAANYATANSDRKTWYETGTFVSIYQTIEDSLNAQLFKRYGWHFEFEPEKLAAFQTEEADRSGAVATLTSTMAQNPQEFLITCDILGIELTEEQEMAVQALIDNEPVTIDPVPSMPMDAQQDNPDDMTDEQYAEDVTAEILAWRNFAGKSHKRDFEVHHIPATLAAQIRAGLKSGVKIDEVFTRAQADLQTALLAQKLDRLVIA